MLLLLFLHLIVSTVFVGAIHEPIGTGAFLGFLTGRWRWRSIDVQLVHTSMQGVGHLIVHGGKHHWIHHGMIHHWIGHGLGGGCMLRLLLLPHVVVP